MTLLNSNAMKISYGETAGSSGVLARVTAPAKHDIDRMGKDGFTAGRVGLP